MPALPIVERELTVSSRRPRLYLDRLIAALIALLLLGYLSFLSTRVRFGVTAGQQIFTLLTQFAFFYCLFSGIGQTSDTLSREKREGTLGLLFLTDLKGYDVVFGKLIASSIRWGSPSSKCARPPEARVLEFSFCRGCSLLRLRRWSRFLDFQDHPNPRSGS